MSLHFATVELSSLSRPHPTKIKQEEREEREFVFLKKELLPFLPFLLFDLGEECRVNGAAIRMPRSHGGRPPLQQHDREIVYEP